MNKKIWGPVAVLMLLAVLLGGAFLLLRQPQTRGGEEARDETARVTSAPEPTPTPEPTPEPTPTPEPEDGDLVVVQDWIPTIFVELRYATPNNFTGRVIYDFTQAQLRYGTVKKLARVQEALLREGYSLKIWDAYRPVHAQFRLWEICPNSAYVANPNTGYSSHSRGNTVDLTLVRQDGTEIEMPSDFDEFSAIADRNYGDVSQAARDNVMRLENAMQAEGFVGYSAEWWHFSDGTFYDVVTD